MGLGIYIHLPICMTRCNYCDFYSQTDMSVEDSLAAGIHKELKLVADKSGETAVETIYIGGGTPSCLKTESLTKLLRAVDDHFGRIRGDSLSEITIEANPDDVTAEKLTQYKQMGINRISLGAQSFLNRELQFLNRRHTAAQNRQAIESIMAAGFDNFSLDLIFGLPGQTSRDFMDSLEQALQFGPKHISLYCLTYEKGTELYRMMTCGEIEPLGDEMQVRIFGDAIEALSEAGYIGYEISNFAWPGYECRHNLNYWKMGDYLGFGPSAHSSMNNRRWSNYADLEKYLLCAQKNTLPIEFEEEINPDLRKDEFIMLSLRLKEGIDLEKYKKISGKDLRETRAQKIEGLIESGLAEIHGKFLRLTLKGIFVADEISAALI
jgi:oxygen-independent coproporphyrinogen-3 oxidase